MSDLRPRRLLYISPYFPPMARVGALRPVKFVRHLPAFGWESVVLCDLVGGEAVNAALLDEVPASTTIIWDYGRKAAVNKARFDQAQLLERAGPGHGMTRPGPGLLARLGARIPKALIPEPEFLPLNEHSLDMPHAHGAARRALAAQPCDAIMVNADPFAAPIIGAGLARETGLPLIVDFRDPWAVCTLRRHKRHWPQRKLVDALERRVVEQASTLILNTETARRDYAEFYADIPSERFVAIRNHGDAELISRGTHRGFSRFTMLFMGNFRRFVEGDNLLEALAELARRGLSGAQIGLAVSGRVPAQSRERARALGVEDMLELHPFVPYQQVGALMDAADLLISSSHDTEQRIPAKIFDYATSTRPMLVVGGSRELTELMATVPGARCCGRLDIEAIADAMQAAYEAGRQREVDRRGAGLDSRSATAKLARVLDAATRAGGG